MICLSLRAIIPVAANAHMQEHGRFSKRLPRLRQQRQLLQQPAQPPRQLPSRPQSQLAVPLLQENPFQACRHGGAFL